MIQTPVQPALLRPRRAIADLLVLAGPIIASMVSRTIMNFVDFIMVSELGEEAQAAILPAGLVLFCIVAFGMGVTNAVSTYVSQSFGRERWSDCSAYAWQGLYLSLAMGVLFAPVYFLVGPLFHLAGHEPAVMRMEITYGQIGTLGIFPAVAGASMTNFFTGLHRPTIALTAAVVSNIFNIFANMALIFGYWGFPEMGIAGAAWGTLAAASLQAAILVGWMWYGRYRKQYDSRRTWRIDIVKLRQLVRLGLPVGLVSVSDIVSWAIFTIFIVGQFGTAHLAANNIAFKLYELVFMPTMGLGIAVSASVGKAIGRGRRDIARQYARWGLAMTLTWTSCIGLLFIFAGGQLAGLLTDNGDVQHIATYLLLFCAFAQLFDSLYLNYIHALRGAGDNTWPAIVATCYSIFIMLGGAFTVAHLRPDWLSYGPWTVLMVYVAIYGTTMWARWRFGPWERIDLMGDRRD
jgi:MATE family multidrug resistance protein